MFVACLAGLAPARACGPFFPNAYILWGDAELLAAPPGSFVAELARLRDRLPPQPGKWLSQFTGREEIIQADVADLRAALAAQGVSQDNIERIASGYRGERHRLEGVTVSPGAAPGDPMDGVPQEFKLYYAGATAWKRGDRPAAMREWEALLALPERERHYHSTWAAYMLARAYAEQADAEHRAETAPARRVSPAALATDYARRTRALAAAGFADSAGLANASYGWEAKAALVQGDLATAAHLYFVQFTLSEATAVPSLRLTAQQMRLADAASLQAWARDPVARGVLNAYFLSGAGHALNAPPETVAHWLQALQQQGVRAEPEAERFAWFAYKAGDFDAAQQWAALAPGKAALIEWVRAKLALRAGDLAAGEEHLRNVLDAHELDQAG